MNIYIYLFLIVVASAAFFKGFFKQNKFYIILMAMMLFGVCAFRDVRVGADLGRYETHFNTCMELNFKGVFELYQWDCIGFYQLMKLFQILFGNNYHGFLAMLAIVEGIIFVYIVYRHSVNPYMSILLYMALGYYIFIYSGLKQALATAFIMLAFDFLVKKKKALFFVFTLVAGLFHAPAIIFIGAYFVADRRINVITVCGYIFSAIIMFAFSGQIAGLLAEAYDSAVTLSGIGGVGGKCIMMMLFVVVGFILRLPNGENRTYLITFNLMIIATILQILAMYGNVFERLADYYFIFSIIYIPLIFEKENRRVGSKDGILLYDRNVYAIANVALVAFAFIYFYLTVNATYGILPYVLNQGG